MLKSVLFFSATLCLAAPAQAQVYTSSQYSAAYVPVTGGTVLSFRTTDDSATLAAIGFTFNFYGQPYTHVNIGTNGFLAFAPPCQTSLQCPGFAATCTMNVCADTSASTAAPAPFPDAQDPNAFVAAFWDDLVVENGARVVTQLQGTAPSRTFVVEWQAVRHYDLGTRSGDTATFQVRLQEDGAIQVAWGPHASGVPLGQWSGNIGVEDPDGLQAEVPALPCANADPGSGACALSVLQSLTNQVFEVRLVDGPELIGQVHPPPGGDPGAAIRVGVSARNIGTRTTTSGFGANVYFSTDQVITPGMDTLLGRVSLPAVAAGATRTSTLSTRVPALLMPGVYYVGAVVDPENVVPEVSKQNNTAVSGPFLVGPEINGTISGPARTGPGETFDATLSIHSDGSPVSFVGYRIYLSVDGTLDGQDILVATGTAAVGGQPTASVTIPVTLAANLQPAEYHLAVRFDPSNAIVEIDETNNTNVSSSSLRVVGPDIVAADLMGATSAFRGLSYDVTATLRNAGGARAENFFYAFYFSDNQLVTITDPKLGEIGPITLAGGQTITVHHTFTVASTIAAGNYYLGIISDSTSQILEEVENNNIKRQTAVVVVRDPAPDFATTALTPAGGGAAGESLVVARTLSNLGNATGDLSYAMFLSSDATIDPATDVPIGTGQTRLGALQDDEGVDMAHIPSDTPAGNYYVGYVVDPANAVAELSESNNTAASAATITIEAGALKILTQSLPSATVGLPYQFDIAARGGSGRYSWMLQGTLPAGLSFDDTTGRISGNPSREGQVSLVVVVTDGTLSARTTYSLIVAEPTLDLSIITRAIPPAFVGRRFDFPLTAVGGVPPYVWTADGALPTGLQLTASGVISGTPPTAGLQTLTFHVRDVAGHMHERPITVRVVASEDALRFSNDVLRDGVVNKPYDDSFRVMNGVSPYRYELSSGSVPKGLAIVDDKLTGTPTVAGTYQFGVRVTDNRGDTDMNRFVVTIEPDEGVKFVTTGLPPGVRGTPYTEGGGAIIRLKAVATGVMGTITFRVLAGDLPPGLSLAATGELSGTPTATGIFTFTAEAKDTAGESDLRALAIVVDEPPAPPTPEKMDSGCGCTSTIAPRGELALLGLALGGLALLRRRRGLLIALGLLSAAVGVQPSASAQTAIPYFLMQETAPYVARTGTVLQFGSDDDDEVVLTLPFAFHFFDQNYAQVHVSTNGYVSFTELARSLGNTGFPDSAMPNAVISGFWDDLLVNEVLTTVEGMAPGRVFIIQWDCSRFGDSSSQLQMQLWLYEGVAGRFELRYGPAMTGSPTTTFEASIGFEDVGGRVGNSWLSCSPNCGDADLAALNGAVLRALQDGGEDVIAQSISTPARVYPGTPIAVNASMQSLHQDPIGPLRYAFYIVPAGTTMLVPPALIESAPVTLTPYQTLMVTELLTVPVNTPPGRYVLALVADSGGQVTEPDESNNVIYSSVFVIGERRPDFTVPSLRAQPTTVAPGDSLTVVVPLSNAGNLDGGTDWEIVLSQNRVISVDDVVVHTASVALPLLTTRTATISVQIPSDLPPGPYYVGVIFDPQDHVPELNEINNATAARDPIAVGVGTVTVLTDSLAGGYVGVDYSAFLSAAGGDGSFQWSLDSGTLPTGLTLLPSSGELRGKPQAAGSFAITVRVTSAGHVATKALSLSIAELGGPLTIVTRNLLPAEVGVSYPPLEPGQDPSTAQRILVVNAQGTATFSLSSAPPPGLSFEADGYLHGVPLQRGVFDVNVSVTDGTSTATRSIALTVVEPGRLSLVSAALPDGVLEEEYRYQLQVLGKSDTASVSFELGPDEALPDGLALTTSGLIVGVPTRIGRWRFAVTAVEGPRGPAGGGASDSANFTLEVKSNVGFGITPTSLPIATVGTPYDATLEARGGNAPFVWRLAIQGMLPRGMRFEVEDGAQGRQRMRFLGTPEVVPEGEVNTGGLVSFLVTVEDSLGRKASQPLAIRVVTPPPPPLPEVKTGGCSCSSQESAPGSVGLGFAAALIAGVLSLRRPGRTRRR